MKKKKYSSHLSIKRLRDLATDYSEQKGMVDPAQWYFLAIQFINFVEKSRPSLGGRPKSLPVGEKKL